jgi:hypothetical protein
VLDPHRADCVAAGGKENRAAGEQLVGVPGDVDSEQRDDASEADQQTERALGTP